jgi:hypothetical protein
MKDNMKGACNMSTVIYETLEPPNEHFISCIEGRMFSGFKFLVDDCNRRKDFYYLLCNCVLKFVGIKSLVLKDPWYYQPIEILVDNMYSIETNQGFEYLKSFANLYGVLCHKEIFESKDEVVDWAEKVFERNGIPIALIDQFKYPRSSKYMVQKDATHALLLYGVDLKRKEFFVCDSSSSRLQGVRYSIYFKELEYASINVGISMEKNIYDFELGKQLLYDPKKTID